MTDFDIQINRDNLARAVTDTLAAQPRFGDSLAADEEDTTAMVAFLDALRTHSVLTAVRRIDGLCLDLHPALRSGADDSGYAFDDLEVTLVRRRPQVVTVLPNATIRTRPAITQVLFVDSVSATALLDVVDPLGKAGPERTAQLVVDHIAQVLRQAVNNSAQLFAA